MIPMSRAEISKEFFDATAALVKAQNRIKHHRDELQKWQKVSTAALKHINQLESETTK